MRNQLNPSNPLFLALQCHKLHTLKDAACRLNVKVRLPDIRMHYILIVLTTSKTCRIKSWDKVCHFSRIPQNDSKLLVSRKIIF